MLLGDENEHSEGGAEQEVASYFAEKTPPRNTNLLEWWRMNEHQFPQIGTKKTTLFAKAGQTITKRSSLSPKKGNAILFLNANRKYL